MGLKEKFKYEAPLILSDYQVLYQNKEKLRPESHTQLMLTNKRYQETFDEFFDTIMNGIERKIFIPVYRMADGEFKFVNKRLLNDYTKSEILVSFKSKIKYFIKNNYMYGRRIKVNKFEILKNIFDPGYQIVAHGEGYTRKEILHLKGLFPKWLKNVSENGKLALHFVKRENKLVYEEAIYKFMAWIDNNKIDINEKNYLPFYHVYAIVNGKRRTYLFKNRKILIVTNYDLKKKKLIEKYLYNKENVSKVSFIKISSNKSLIDRIDASQYIGKIDLALIGAGIGSINILLQLESLSVPCLDIGYALECMANDNLRKDRMFLELI